jgi:Tol biopolymer transport system component
VQQDLALIDRAGAAQPLRLPAGSYLYPRISPDGGRIAVQTDDGKESTIAIYDLSGVSSIRRLTIGGNNRFPVWSPDGQRVAFQSDRDGDRSIFWQRADGSGPAERITKADEGSSHVPESWPKGDRFSFSVIKETQTSLWTYSIATKKAEPFDDVRSAALANSAFSPDGRWLAYTAGETPATAIFVQPFPPNGSKHEIARGGVQNPFWSPSGTELLYSSGSGAPFMAVTVATAPSFTFSKPVAIPRSGLIGVSALDGARYYDIAADGKHIIGVIESGQAQSGTAALPTIAVVINWFEELRRKVPLK